MKNDSILPRRDFMKIGALAATAAMLPTGVARAATEHLLPDLPYGFDALAPHIDAKTMEIHHDKHHAAYVKNLNDALKGSGREGTALEDLLSSLPGISDEALRTTVRNNGGGHWNHAFFWKTLAPAADLGKPSGELAEAIDEAFGSLDEFKAAFGAAAAKRFGSGWAWLIVRDGKLKITSTPNQDNPLMKGIVADEDLGVPVLGLDVWEHAYYLNYQNRRPDYVTAWWNVVNWEAVGKRFAE